MKVSVITAVLNGKGSLEQCMISVFGQTYQDIEYIIVDGGSVDGTLDVIKKYEQRIYRWTSNSDKGIYEALNKGLKMASGEIVGFLHADDFYAHEAVIEKVVADMSSKGADSCYGDLLYVDKKNTGKTVRYWRSGACGEGCFERGWMPPHPTFFARRELYERYGYFDVNFRISADYELMLRFLKRYKISTSYIPEVLVKMRMGGASNRNLKNLLMKTTEDYRAWEANGLQRKFYTIPLKNILKIPQFFRR